MTRFGLAKAPDRFTLKFLEDIGFKSTNDRLFIPILKALKFIDENGVPTKRYFRFLDDAQWRVVLAEGISEAYADLFTLHTKAHTLSKQELTGKLRSLTEGKNSDVVLANMARTFTELAKLADFNSAPVDSAAVPKEPERAPAAPQVAHERLAQLHPAYDGDSTGNRRFVDAITYRIEIVLPPVRDQAVYDAIFRSLKEHLL